MNPLVKEENDAVDNAPKVSENEAPSDCNTDRDPLSAEPNMVSQVESNPMNRELDIPASEEHAVLQPTENNEPDVEKNQKDPEDLKEEESCLIQISISQKLIFVMSRLGRITHLNTPANINESNPLTNIARSYSRNTPQKTSEVSYIVRNSKIPFQFSTSWRIPITNNHERRRILSLLCGRYFSQAAGDQNIMKINEKDTVFPNHTNIFIHKEKVIILRRPLRVYYQRPFNERMASKNKTKLTDTKRKEKFCILVRPRSRVPRTQLENIIRKYRFGNDMRTHHFRRVILLLTDDGWKYRCPICGDTFNNLGEFRQHTCNPPQN
ncbi:CPX chromosomal region candidate gene 1 protein [Saccopteryx leptura]|uniref:CPX chromosomal region candidate gene 1 protein n=1 Tax=Saccopteryx leptura TaxID=249018 RepID=UPI00339BD6A4